MAKALKIEVKESIAELRGYQRTAKELVKKRLSVLIEIKRHEDAGISKRKLSDKTGVNHNSVNKWRRMYLEGGIDSILNCNRKGYKKSIINAEQHEQLKELLCDPRNGICGYKELQQWVLDNFGIKIKYTTLNEYAKRHFGTKVKVARKSHLKKDDEAVETFKKTSNLK